MKKVLLTSMILLSTVSFGGNVYAQETGGEAPAATTPTTAKASVTFTPSVDGKTLTISGQGDLTSFSEDKEVMVFTEDANGKVYDVQYGGGNIAGKLYDPSMQYYKIENWNSVKIDNNEEYFTENSNFLKKETVHVSFAEKLADYIANGTYATVKFENTSSSDNLLINSDIIRKILFIEESNWGTTWTKINSSLVELDLGQATCLDFSSATFETKNDKGNINGEQNLTTLTLPLTIKTEVLSESTGKNEEKMIVPEKVLADYWTKLSTITIPEGYDRLGKDAFYNRTGVTKFNLPSSLTLIGESAFANCTSLAEIELNEGLENIGKSAFVGTKLTSIHFPSTLKIIDDAAFFCLPIYGLKFNAGLKYIGNTAFGLTGNSKDNSETTLEIPASVRYIGPFAFAARYYQDVYFYGDRAPIMPEGKTPYINDMGLGTAFSENTYMGNNGFNPGKEWKEGDAFDDAYVQGYANRENYKTGGVYFTMLHFPKDLTDEQREAYTDITRVYKTASEDQTFVYGKTDSNPNTYIVAGEETENLTYHNWTAEKNVDFGFQDTYLGRQYVWPSQQMWRRSYVVNSLGYKWDGVTPYRTDLTDGDLAILAYAGYKVGTEEGEYSLDELQRIAHLGTRQFVLGNADVNVDKEEEKEPEYPISMEGGKWWTICVPFNMTKKQVDDTFGVNTHVCRFNDVHRLQDKVGNHYLKLYFQQDVYVHKSTKDANGKYTTYTGVPVGDDDIVIYAHESYMIRPTLDNKDANKMYNIKNYKLEVGSPIPTVIVANAGWDNVESDMQPMEDDEETIADRTYRFVGNYQTSVASSQSTSEQESGVATQAVKTVTIPQFSFIYAKKKNYPNYQFWFYYGTKMAWAPNKCVVQASAREGGVRDAELFYNLTQDANGNWIPNTSLSAKKVSEQSFFGASDETTEINNVVVIAGDGEDSEIVYNLNGQVINNNGNLNGLQKGVYIKNGKKYMVK